jgi:hypothetical protein
MVHVQMTREKYGYLRGLMSDDMSILQPDEIKKPENNEKKTRLEELAVIYRRFTDLPKEIRDIDDAEKIKPDHINAVRGALGGAVTTFMTDVNHLTPIVYGQLALFIKYELSQFESVLKKNGEIASISRLASIKPKQKRRRSTPSSAHSSSRKVKQEQIDESSDDEEVFEVPAPSSPAPATPPASAARAPPSSPAPAASAASAASAAPSSPEPAIQDLPPALSRMSSVASDGEVDQEDGADDAADDAGDSVFSMPESNNKRNAPDSEVRAPRASKKKRV